MTEIHITGAGHRETVTCGDRRYTLRPLTFGEAARLAEIEAEHFQGGPQMVNELLRAAAERTLPPDQIGPVLRALDDYEAADAAVLDAVMARPHEQEGPEKLRDWQIAFAAASNAAERAKRRAEAATFAVATDPQVVAARKALARATYARATSLAAMTLVGWEGPDLPPWPEGGVTETDVAALPVSDVTAIQARAQAMTRPGTAEGKA